MFQQRTAQSRAPVVALVLIGAYAATAWLSLEYLRGNDGRTALYTSNAFLLSGLLILRGRWRIVCLIGSMAACSLVVWARGAAPISAVSAGVVAGASSLAGAFLGRWALPQPRLKTLPQAVKVLVMAALPSSLVSAVLSAAMMHLRGGSDFVAVSVPWFAASFLGTSMVLPALLMLATPQTVRQVRRSGVENVLLAAFVAGLLAAPFVGLFYAALILAFPAANLFALRLGGRKTAMIMLAVNLTTFAYPFLDDTVSSEPAAYQRMILAAFQLYTIVVFYNGLLTALAVDHQTRVKRQLERRTAMARAARARALDASRAKTEFLATMSHEVRTPLNSILGFSQLLDRRDDLSDEARRHVEMIQASGESLLTIVNDILDFSRVEAGKLTLDPRPTNLAKAAAEALAIVQASAQQKGLSLSMTTKGEVGGFHLVDDHRIRQVLLNFLNNAVKFTDEGSVALDLTVTPDGCGRDRIRIAVTDTGVGIAPEALEKLFERFTQADSSISRSYGGAGLGLSICKGLIELMGGRVGASSVPGKGSTFWFELALPETDAEEAKDAAAQAPAITARILLVDDNAANRELGLTVLDLLGCETHLACDGAEAIEAVRSRAYDLVLMDVHMPGVDGLAATRAIRALKGEAGRIPIIAMSADVLPEQIERCRAAGMVDHVAKPIRVEELYACIARWTAGEPTGAKTAAA